MSRWPHITIAGVVLKDASGGWCRAEFVDSEGLKGTIAASHTIALDGTVHTQWSEREQSAIHYGVRITQLLVSKLEAIIAATEDALRAGEDFVVQGADEAGVDTIEVLSRIDYEAQGGKPFARGDFSGAYIRNVVFRFISTGEST